MRDYKECLFNNNGVWAFKYVIENNLTGKTVRKSKSTGVKFVPEAESIKLHRQSRRQAEQVMYEYLDGLEGSDVNADMYFWEWLEIFMEHQKTHLALTSWVKDSNRYQVQVLPYFKEHAYTLKELRPMHLNTYFDYLKTEKNLSNSSRRKCKSICNSALDYAMKNQIIAQNVCKLTVSIPKTSYDYDWYDIEELKQLLAAAQGDELEPVIMLCVILGLRREEALGLRWSAIDFEKRTLTIKGSLIYVPGAQEKYQYIEHVKTQASKAVYGVDDLLFDYLVNLKAKQDKMDYINPKWKDFVCLRPNGDVIKPDHVTGRFQKLLAANGLRKIRFHDLRHSCITLLSQTCSVKELQAYARHSNFQTTMNIYTHVRDNQKTALVHTVTSQLFD